MKYKLKFLKKKSFYLTIGSISTIGSFAYFGRSLILDLKSVKSFLHKPKDKSDKQYIYLSEDLNDYMTEEGLDECTTSRNKDFSRSHLHLLALSQYKKDNNIREFAIQTIAKTQLFEYQCREIAQSCDLETSVRLARIPNVNLKLFLPPIKTNLIKLNSKTSVDPNIHSLHYFDYNEVLLHLLREANISGTECSQCVKYFTQIAIDSLEREQNPIEIHHYLDYNDIHKHKLFDVPKVNWICLQAIMENISCGKSQCLKLVDNGLFIILHYIREKFTDLNVQTWVAHTLANLSTYKETHFHFYCTGFIGVLAQWLQSNHLELSLSAAKILYNMSEDSNNYLLPKSMYLIHPIFQESKNKNFDVILVHGLLGGAFKTWRQSDSQKCDHNYTRCWPQKWLANDINNIRILAVNYETYLSNWNIQCQDNIFTLKERSSQLLNDLMCCNVGHKPIIWITHSMGGLLVKQILNDISESSDSKSRNILEHTKGIIFYSVPHKGTEMAVWSPGIQRIISPSSEVLGLRKDSELLISLHNQFVKLANNKIKCLSFGETEKSTVVKKPFKWKYLLVPDDSANPGIGHFHLLSADHFNTCKPKSKSSDAYYMALDFIKDIIESHLDEDDGKRDKITILLSSVFS